MANYKDVVKSFNKYMDALKYWLNTNTEKGVAHIPEGILEATIEDYKTLRKFDATPITHGHWIDKGHYITTAYSSIPVMTCSVCKAEVTINDFYDSYCPNCGTKMDGTDDELNA